MNISDINNKIYGLKTNMEGEYTDFLIERLEEQEIENVKLNNYKNDDNFNIIKF